MPKIDPTILTAIFGLIGVILTAIFSLIAVIVGGWITRSATYAVEEKRANREETTERRKRLVDLQRAARLVHEDFSRALGSMEFAIKTRKWTHPKMEPIRLESWKEHRSVFATETTFNDWAALKAAVRDMEGYQMASTEAIRENDWNITENRLRGLEATKDAIEKGLKTLTPFLNLVPD